MRTTKSYITFLFIIALSGLAHPCLSQWGNYRPVIVGQRPLTVEQGKSITIQFEDLTVIDLDDQYPEGFTMRIRDRANYSVDGRTITPRENFTGTLFVPVSVDDGQDESRNFDLRIEVIEVQNVPPTITGQNPISITQGESITIPLKHLIVSDPDDNYPGGFSLEVFDGPNYDVSNNRVTPSSSFTGTLNVGVRVNDGEDESPVFNLQIVVRPSNVAPVITGQSRLATPMNTALTISLSHLTVTDPDDNYPSNFTLKISDGPNYSVSGTTITPSTNYIGSDGSSESKRWNSRQPSF